jgi:hypothetical protein
MPIPILLKPIIIQVSTLFAEQNEAYTPNGMEIVPWKPTGAALALQVFATSTEYHGLQSQEQQNSQQNATATFGQGFEFEAQASQPSPAMKVYKRRSRPSKTMGLPTVASVHNPDAPVVDESVRRSTRLKAAKAGFSYRLDKNPTKKHKITALQINIDGEACPVAIDTLQSWGVKCGVDPSELTEEALMQVPPEDQFPPTVCNE